MCAPRQHSAVGFIATLKKTRSLRQLEKIASGIESISASETQRTEIVSIFRQLALDLGMNLEIADGFLACMPRPSTDQGDRMTRAQYAWLDGGMFDPDLPVPRGGA